MEVGRDRPEGEFQRVAHLAAAIIHLRLVERPVEVFLAAGPRPQPVANAGVLRTAWVGVDQGAGLAAGRMAGKISVRQPVIAHLDDGQTVPVVADHVFHRQVLPAQVDQGGVPIS